MSEQHTPNSLDRRAFLKNVAGLGLTGTALAGCARLSSSSPASIRPTPNNIGVQLYTVRDLLQQDFEGTLEKVAQIGYKEVEFAGYYNRTPEQIRALLNRLGLRAPSAHIGVPLLRQDLAGQIASAKTIGHGYITVPSVPRANTSADTWRQVAAEFNRFGQAVRQQGLRFAYHNHDFEFQPLEGGRTGYDILLAETDPALVDFELDLYWATRAGRDPVQLFQRSPGRFTMWHVKDMRNPQGTKEMAPVGQGNIDFRRIFASAPQSGLRHFFVEHDNAAQTGGSLASIQASFQNLRQLLG